MPRIKNRRPPPILVDAQGRPICKLGHLRTLQPAGEWRCLVCRARNDTRRRLAMPVQVRRRPVKKGARVAAPATAALVEEYMQLLLERELLPKFARAEIEARMAAVQKELTRDD